MEFQGIELVGPLALSGNEGLAGQPVVSAGPGAVPVFITPASLVNAGTTLTIGYVGTTLTVTVNGQTQTVNIPSGTVTSVADTNSIDLALASGALSAVLLLDPIATNHLSVTAAGVKAVIAVTNSIAGAGTAGSPLALSGDVAIPGNNKVYGTDAAGTRGWQSNVTRVFKQASPSATSFVITHNLNNQYPAITVYRTDTVPPTAITPQSIQATSVNSLTINLAAARPIAVTVVG